MTPGGGGTGAAHGGTGSGVRFGLGPASTAASVGGTRAGHQAQQSVPPTATAAGGAPVDVPRETTIHHIEVSRIRANERQPRETFDPAAIEALAASIKASGLLQPVLVRPIGSGPNQTFELIAGERRLRAVRSLGLQTIPAVVREATDAESAQIALIENLQREDLNPAERAFALRALCDEFGLTHQEVADRVGLERASVTNLVRLTELDAKSLDLVRSGRLSAGHGRALLGLADLGMRSLLAESSIREEWSVRTLEREVQRALAKAQSGGSMSPGRLPTKSANAADLEKRLSRHLGTRVHLHLGRKKGTGRLTLEFFSIEQFDGLMSRLGFDPGDLSD